MTETPDEIPHDQVSNRGLLLACLVAVIMAVVALVLFVWPAEYGKDPTGIGSALGLTRLAETAPAARPVFDPEAEGNRQDNIDIVIPAGGGLEYKLHAVKGDHIEYSWSSGDTELYFDFHGEPDGDATGYFESYAEGTAAGLAGSLNAPFDGRHGWYWENNTDGPVTVSLLTFGAYTVVGKL
jgi:hypothetical protein